MTDPQKVQALNDDLNRLINRYRAEFEMTLASVVGTLEVIKHALIQEAITDPTGEDDDDDGTKPGSAG